MRTMPTQEKPGSKSQGELVVHEEERQKAMQDIVQSWEKVKAFAMDTENIRVLQFVKERLDQAIEPVMGVGHVREKERGTAGGNEEILREKQVRYHRKKSQQETKSTRGKCAQI